MPLCIHYYINFDVVSMKVLTCNVYKFCMVNACTLKAKNSENWGEFDTLSPV